MFCDNCGNELREGALFCPKCGTPVNVIHSVQDDADQNQYVNDSPDYHDQQTSNQTIDDKLAYQRDRHETDWNDGYSNDLSASDQNPKKTKKPVKWIIIAGVSLVLVVSLVVVAISVVIPLFTTSNSVLQNQNSVWADTSVVEYYFTNNLKKEKSELNKCRYYDLRIDNFSILLVQYSRAGNNDFEYYFFPSFYGNTLDELMLIKQYSFFEKNDIPLIYDAQTISKKQQNGYVITKLQLSFSFLNKYFGVDWDSADIHIASNMNNGCVERVILGADVRCAIWSFQYSANKQFDKVLLALTEDAELGNTELINPDVSLQDIFSKSRYYNEYTYDYNNTGDLIKAGCMEPNQRSKVGFSFEYNSNNKRISSAGIQTNNDKYVSNYTRDKNGLLNHIHIDYYSNDMTKAKNSYDYDISYNNDSIKLSVTNGENSIKDIKEESDETSLESDLEESDESSHETPAEESEDNDSAEERDKDSDDVDSGQINESSAEEPLKQSEQQNQNERFYFTLGGNKISIELPSNWQAKTTSSNTGEDITFTVTETNGRDYTVCLLRCMTESEYERVKEWYEGNGISFEDAAEYYGNKGDYYYAMVWLDGYGYIPSTQLVIDKALRISRDVAKTFLFCD